MSKKIPTPTQSAPLCTCPQCGTALTIDIVWFRFLAALVFEINKTL